MRSEPSPSLAESYAVCRRVTAGSGTSFAIGIRLTPARCRPAMTAIYAWMRLADDAADADAPADDRRAVLDAFEFDTRGTLAGTPPDRSLWPAVAEAVREHQIEPAWLLGLIAGVRQDVGLVDLDTDGQLMAYCDRVAGNVGRCCTAIWGLRPGVSRDAALELAALRGRGFQLINIARDLESDLAAGRRYLPRERLARLGIDPTSADGVRAARADLAAAAEAMLAESAPLDGLIRRDARAATWAMTSAYGAILGRLRRQRPPRLTAASKLRVAIGALARRVLPAGAHA